MHGEDVLYEQCRQDDYLPSNKSLEPRSIGLILGIWCNVQQNIPGRHRVYAFVRSHGLFDARYHLLIHLGNHQETTIATSSVVGGIIYCLYYTFTMHSPLRWGEGEHEVSSSDYGIVVAASWAILARSMGLSPKLVKHVRGYSVHMTLVASIAPEQTTETLRCSSESYTNIMSRMLYTKRGCLH